MDRLLTGIAIALAALVMSGALVHDATAGGVAAKAPEPAPSVKSPTPVADGSRSELVLGLVLTLDALRTAPAVFGQRRI